MLVSDKKDRLFAWVGRDFNPPGGEPKEQFALDACKVFRKLHPHIFRSTPKTIVVHEAGGDSHNDAFFDTLDLL